MKNIFIPQPIAVEAENFLTQKGYEIYRGSGDFTDEGIKKDISFADAFILRSIKISEEILANANKLKVISRHGAGYDNLDVNACNDKGIVTTYSPLSTSISVAEYVMTSILSLSKNFRDFEENLRNDNFNYKYSNRGLDVANKTLGIIGFGKIGKEVARKAHFGLDMKVVTFLKENKKEELPDYVEGVSWDKLFEISDYVTIHVPGTKDNYNLISKKEFNLMKKDAFLINASRGKVMSEKDFILAIKNKDINGAVIDVFDVEPPNINGEIFKLENVILTPHIGSNTKECMIRIAMDCANDVHRVLSNEAPLYPIMK